MGKSIGVAAAAAKELGIGVEEVLSVEYSPAGSIVTTTDGVRYVVVAPDNPDAEGKTGVMFLIAPTERYSGTFPVYAQPGDPDPVTPEGSPSAAPEADANQPAPTWTSKEVLEWVAGDPVRARAAMAAEQAAPDPRSTLLSALEKLS